jgi:hypothetical protein
MRALPAPAAIAVAAGGILLGALGAARLLGGRLPAFGGSLAGVAVAVLALFPFYQPGERAAAVERGLQLLGVSEERSASAARWLALFGADRERPREARPEPAPLEDWVAAVPVAPAPAPEAPQRVALPEPSARPALPDLAAADETLPLRRVGEHLLVVAHLESRDGANDLPLIVDTGAAITTLTRRGADAVELERSDESPVVVLNGVGGRSEAQLAVVETLWLGDQAVGPLTVAVCDACLPVHGEGLLGIDVLSHFASEIDGDGLRLALRRSSRAPPRDLVTPFLRVAARLRIRPRGEVRGEIEVRNLAPVDVGDVRLTIECPHETFDFALDFLPADGDERVDVALPWGTECPEFRAAVASAHWR